MFCRPALLIAFVWPAFLLADDSPVDFNRDIRPILADTCFECHGPDKNKREGDLRLDTRDGLFAQRDGSAIVVPGKPDQSELYRRITDTGDLRMPPADAKRQLEPDQVDRIRRWIAGGAQWQQHWAFVAPRRPQLPKVQKKGWCRNGIDHFVLSRLEKEGLQPSHPAEKTTLIRRVTLDLTGLPPTPEEVDAFLADRSPNAYGRLVDRLLKSPRYGERMASRWLDAARYADTSGYQNDGPRDMWRWRDWVINAYNRNMPFDQFTIEQIAGDLLPDPSLDQLIATGFNRNHRGNAEGGIIPEEFQVEYVVDRVDTTATVWLGLTMGCARCHEHKYDPISQTEFYRLFAYFNNVPENGRAIKEGNSPPYIKAPTPAQQQKLDKLKLQLTDARQRFAGMRQQIAGTQRAWERRFKADEGSGWTITDGLVARFDLDGGSSQDKDRPIQFVDGDPSLTEGRLGQAADLDGNRYVDAGDTGDFGYFDKFSLAAWVYPRSMDGSDVPHGGTIVSRMTDLPRADGYYVQLLDGKIHVNLVKRWLDDSIRVATVQRVEPNEWQHVLVTYDGSRVAQGIQVYLNGRALDLDVHLDGINQTFQSDEPLRIGAGGGPDARFIGAIDDVRVYERVLDADEAQIVATANSIGELVALPVEQRSKSQADKLRTYFLRQAAPAAIRQLDQQIRQQERELAAFVESLPTVMVMQDMDTLRTTHLLLRGQYDKPGPPVTPGVPAIFPPLPDGAPNNRLGLARWLTDPANPLTARVAVNRYWQAYFGRGLVRTVEDFGTQGTPPTHRALLDWLATEFVECGWDVKQMQKRIVMSATYRQTSRGTPEQIEEDPENRLLARGPRFRLSAEMIRDQALFVSGLLVEKVGGPSVKPYQPKGLWKEIATVQNYEQGQGDDLYRRSLYTYWKRTVAAPTLMNFDASAREACTVRQTRTNTPLQALTLMNDVTFVEAARVLAQRVISEAGPQPQARLTRAFRLATSRRPKPEEIDILVRGLEQYRHAYQAEPKAAKDFVSAGESPIPNDLDIPGLAAYTAVASLILNLDEVVVKQ